MESDGSHILQQKKYKGDPGRGPKRNGSEKRWNFGKPGKVHDIALPGRKKNPRRSA